jgi:hydroxyacylglutathione hydrolase
MDIIVDSSDLKIQRLILSRWRVNSYILICPKTGISALIDVPPEASELVKGLEGTRPAYILLTHGHIDHIAGLSGVTNQVKAPLAIHSGDRDRLPVAPGMILNDNDIIEVGNIKVKVLFTPGHTPGSVCFLIGEHLISGDTLFPGGPGRTDSPADFQQILKSLAQKIFVLPDETRVYPGHGAFTTLKKEKEEFAVFSSRPLDPGLYGDMAWLKS